MPVGEDRLERLIVEGLTSFLDRSVADGEPIPMLEAALGDFFERLLSSEEGWSRYWWIDGARPESIERVDGSTVAMSGIFIPAAERLQWIQPFRAVVRVDASRTRLEAYSVWLGDAAVPIDHVPYGARGPKRWPSVEEWAFGFDRRREEPGC